MPRLIDDCPSHTELQESHCTSVNDYSGRCEELPLLDAEGYNWADTIEFTGRCHETEKCLNMYDPIHSYAYRAYCVSDTKLVARPITHHDPQGRVDASSLLNNIPPLTNNNNNNKVGYSLGVLLVDLGGRHLVNASTITIEEEDTLPPNEKNTPTVCNNCSRIGIGISPAMIQIQKGKKQDIFFDYNVILPFNVLSAVLLIAFSSSMG